MRTMEHPRIDDERIPDRYLADRLSEEDEALFEEHLFECADCLAEVQAGEGLRRGLRAVAAEDAARATVTLGLAAWLRNLRPARLAGFMAVALAFVLLVSAVLWQRSELHRARTLQAATALTEPVGDFLVVSLGVTRDAGGEAAEIRLDPEKEAVLLSLELQTVDAASYRLTLWDAGGTVLWTGDGLEPNLYDTLTVVLPPSFLGPGSYRITVEGTSAAGTEPAGEMELRVVTGD